MSDFFTPVAFQFTVAIGGLGANVDASFQEVRGIGPEMELQSYREGGENNFAHSLPKGVKNPKLSLRRGVVAIDSPLVKWCKDVLEGSLANPITLRSLTVSLCDWEAKPIRAWTIQDAYPVSWSVDPFQADKNQAAIEKIDLAYTAAVRTI